MLDARKLLGASQVAKQGRGGNEDQPKRERPYLSWVEQLRLEPERDRDEHDAREDQKASVSFGPAGGVGRDDLFREHRR